MLDHCFIVLQRGIGYMFYAAHKKISGVLTQVGTFHNTSDNNNTITISRSINGTITLMFGTTTVGSFTDLALIEEFKIELTAYNGTNNPAYQVDWDNFTLISGTSIFESN